MKSSKKLRNLPLAVITGAASGIGLAATHRFVREGFRVAAVDRSAGGLKRVERSSVGTKVQAFVCDLNNISSLTALAKRIVEELGPPHVLVNNAGVWFYEPITESSDEHWRVSLNVNLIAAAALARGLVRSMKAMRGAAIVNVSSRNALSSSPLASSYDASKAGLLGLTRSLAVELGEFGIRVNAVCPGVIDTPANKKEMNDTTFVKNYLRRKK